MTAATQEDLDLPARAEYRVTFQPSGRRGSAVPDQDLLSVARALGVDVESVCGGKGVCKKCRIRIERPRTSTTDAKAYSASSETEWATMGVTPPTDAEIEALGAEALAAGMRLACQTRVRGDVQVYVPEESRRTEQVVRKAAGARAVAVDPAISSYHVVLDPPTLQDAQADAERLLRGLQQQHGLTGLRFDFGLLQTLPGVARSAGWNLIVVVWQDKETSGIILDVQPAPDSREKGPSRAGAGLDRTGLGGARLGGARPLLGLAVDVGTTTLAAYLTDLKSGEVLATTSAMNPQVAFGDDVIARLHYAASHPDGRRELQRTVIAELNHLAYEAAEHVEATVQDIFDVVIVGNTAMHHLFLGLDARALGAAPFAPAVQGPVDTRASDIGLEFHPACRLHVLPVEAGFVGADNVAVIIAEEPYKQDDALLIIDIGTNGELVLGDRKRMFSTSCATGPALEGAHLEFGMRAAPGAIERVRIDPQTLEVRFKVIGLEGWHTEHPASEVKARGICGSGIIEAAAEMRKAGVILASGSFNPDLSHERVILEDGRPRKFVIAKPEETAIGRAITVSLKDIRAIQLAKAALRAGAEILLRKYGVHRPDRVILAGAFGTYIDKHHALAIGMLPDCDPETVVSVGNAAGDGARFALLNVGKRREAAEVARKVQFIELAIDPDFQDEYIKAMQFDPVPSIPEDEPIT